MTEKNKALPLHFSKALDLKNGVICLWSSYTLWIMKLLMKIEKVECCSKYSMFVSLLD